MERMKNDAAVLQDDLKKYEIMVIITPDIGEDGAKKRLEEIRKLIAGQKGEIFFEDIWGTRNLAYRIKKHDSGFYAVLDFNMLPEMVGEIEATLKLEPEILRHMTVTLPFKYQPKSFIVTEEEEKAAAEKKEKTPARNIAPKKAAVEDKTAAVKEVAEVKVTNEAKETKEEKTEEAPKKTVKKKEEKKETSLEEVDAKLKSIIENPDINF